MTDQDKISRFADGEPVKLTKPRRPWLRVLEICLTWAVVLFVIGGVFYLLSMLIGIRRAHADEPSARIFEAEGECAIDTDLRVMGAKRAACVDRLETAARLARAEMCVNERRRR